MAEPALGDGTKILVGPGATVTIGGGTLFDGDSRVICFPSARIGARCAIAWEVTIMDAGWHRMSHQQSADAPSWSATTSGSAPASRSSPA